MVALHDEHHRGHVSEGLSSLILMQQANHDRGRDALDLQREMTEGTDSTNPTPNPCEKTPLRGSTKITRAV